MTPCLKEVTKVWEEMLSSPARQITKLPFSKINKAVRDGKLSPDSPSIKVAILVSNYVAPLPMLAMREGAKRGKIYTLFNKVVNHQVIVFALS